MRQPSQGRSPRDPLPEANAKDEGVDDASLPSAEESAERLWVEGEGKRRPFMRGIVIHPTA
jgi:hypothetical protein